MQALEDAVDAVGELVAVEEAAAEVPMLPFQRKHQHQRLEHART